MKVVPGHPEKRWWGYAQHVEIRADDDRLVHTVYVSARSQASLAAVPIGIGICLMSQYRIDRILASPSYEANGIRNEDDPDIKQSLDRMDAIKKAWKKQHVRVSGLSQV